MIVASWNIRGFHKPLKQKGVQNLVHSRKIDIVGILESKFNEKTLHNMMQIRFSDMKVVHNFNYNNKGRIFVMWNPIRVDLIVDSMCEQSINATVNCVKTNIEFCVSFVYDLNTIVQRRSLWNNLKSFSAACSLPWKSQGDFNTVLSPDEKKGGLRVRDYDTRDFVDCVSSLDLLDLKFIGCLFTWRSPKVCSKLDRVIVNQKWISSDLNGLAEFVEPGCISDHAILIVPFLHPNVHSQKPFKFFNMWALSDRFLDTVRENWSKIKLQSMQQDMFRTGTVSSDYKDCKRQADLLLEVERSFIAQKAKLTYLQQGDRCTKFFHDLIKRNNKRNAILALKNNAGAIISEPTQIADLFVEC
ncbi:uncharacterized protein [Primulina huaijiensis]|uniref:uncharacterized protein n=1 Tax=Primulina huaijiensis TaxID=1492673 RepID=UPI003CC710A0